MQLDFFLNTRQCYCDFIFFYNVSYIFAYISPPHEWWTVWPNTTKAFDFGCGRKRRWGQHRPGCSGRLNTNIARRMSWGCSGHPRSQSPSCTLEADCDLQFAKQGEQGSGLKLNKTRWIKLWGGMRIASFAVNTIILANCVTWTASFS